MITLSRTYLIKIITCFRISVLLKASLITTWYEVSLYISLSLLHLIVFLGVLPRYLSAIWSGYILIHFYLNSYSNNLFFNYNTNPQKIYRLCSLTLYNITEKEVENDIAVLRWNLMNFLEIFHIVVREITMTKQ